VGRRGREAVIGGYDGDGAIDAGEYIYIYKIKWDADECGFSG
jgi:hypothetical protein